MPVPPIGYSNLTLTSSYPNLAKEIKQIISNTKFDGFWIKRNLSFRKVLTKGGVYPDPTLRLYRKERRYRLDVHEQAVVDGPADQLQNDLLHYADPTFERFLFRNNRYSTLLATKSKIPHLSTISS